MRFLLVAVLLIGPLASLRAAELLGVEIDNNFDTSMTFDYKPALMTDSEAVVTAIGKIEKGSSLAFEKFLDDNQVPAGSIVAFHSPGGSADDGMQIGRIIRKRRLQTLVAQVKPDIGFSKPAICASSCALAFLGGTRRTVGKGSQYGVHNLNSAGVAVPSPLAMGQAAAAVVAQYVSDMGLSSDFLTLMVSFDSSKDEIYWIPAFLRRKLGVETTNIQTRWSIENVFGHGFGYSIIGRIPSEAKDSPSGEVIISCDRRASARPELDVILFRESVFKLPWKVDISGIYADQKAGQAETLWERGKTEVATINKKESAIEIKLDIVETIQKFFERNDQFYVRFWVDRGLSLQDPQHPLRQDIPTSVESFFGFASFAVDFAPERAEIVKFVNDCK